MDHVTGDPDWLSVDGDFEAFEHEEFSDLEEDLLYIQPLDEQDEFQDDEPIPKTSPKQDDLVFMLFSAFIFERRTRQGIPSVDKYLADLSSWLTVNDKLKTDVDVCTPSTLDFDDADSPRVVDALNTYCPEFPLVLLFSKNSGTHVARRLTVRSPSTYSYRLVPGILDLPLLHGGKVVVEGDVSFDSVVDLLSSHKSEAFTTEMEVSGTLVGCNSESVKKAMYHLRQSIYQLKDDELFGFSLSGSCSESFEVDSVLVRKWRISFSGSPSSTLCARKIF